MKSKFLIGLNIFFLTNFIVFSEIRSEINNQIVVRVGNLIISSFDVQNEIVTNLLLNKQEITQENINNNKNFAVKNLINKSIKKNEIKKYEIKSYNKADLKKYIVKVAAALDTSENRLEEVFKNYNIDYNVFVENYKTELIWNTLIFQMYKDQISVNVVDVENELKKVIDIDKVEFNLSEIEIPKSEYSENKLQEILGVIKNEGFNIAAKKFSISPTAKNEGLIGWILQESLSKKYLAEIKKIKVKEVSSPITNKSSISILIINEIRGDGEVNIEEIREKILLKKKEEKLSLFSRSHFSNLENSIKINFQ